MNVMTAKLNRMQIDVRWDQMQQAWSLTCDPALAVYGNNDSRHTPTDDGYELLVRNDGCGQLEFVKRYWKDGDVQVVLTQVEYEAHREYDEQMVAEHADDPVHNDGVNGGPYESDMDRYLVDSWLSWPSAYEAMRQRWDALNMLARFSLS